MSKPDPEKTAKALADFIKHVMEPTLSRQQEEFMQSLIKMPADGKIIIQRTPRGGNGKSFRDLYFKHQQSANFTPVYIDVPDGWKKPEEGWIFGVDMGDPAGDESVIAFWEEPVNDVHIAEAAIRTAIRHGWNEQMIEDEWSVHTSELVGHLVLCYPRPANETVTHIDINALILSHDFAQALWKQCDTFTNIQGTKGMVACNGWQFHLQQLAISTDRLKYVAENAELMDVN